MSCGSACELRSHPALNSTASAYDEYAAGKIGVFASGVAIGGVVMYLSMLVVRHVAARAVARSDEAQIMQLKRSFIERQFRTAIGLLRRALLVVSIFHVILAVSFPDTAAPLLVAAVVYLSMYAFACWVETERRAATACRVFGVASVGINVLVWVCIHSLMAADLYNDSDVPLSEVLFGVASVATIVFHFRLANIRWLYRCLWLCSEVLGFALLPSDYATIGRLRLCLLVSCGGVLGELVGMKVEQVQWFVFMKVHYRPSDAHGDAHKVDAPRYAEQKAAQHKIVGAVKSPPVGGLKKYEAFEFLGSPESENTPIRDAFVEQQFRSSLKWCQRFMVGTILLLTLHLAITRKLECLITLITSAAGLYKVLLFNSKDPEIERARRRVAELSLVVVAFRWSCVLVLDALKSNEVAAPESLASRFTSVALIAAFAFHFRVNMTRARYRALLSILWVTGVALRPESTFSKVSGRDGVLLMVSTAFVFGELVGGVVIHILWTAFLNNYNENRLIMTPAQRELVLSTLSSCSEMGVEDKLSLEQFCIRRESLRLEERIGSGHFAEVIRASLLSTVFPDLEIMVAVKVLHREHVRKSLVKMIVEEVVIMSRFRHPNLITYIGYTFLPFVSIVLEYASRGTILNVLVRAGGKDAAVPMLLKLVTDVCRGMAYLHEVGTVHNDLKGDNVFVTDDMTAKVGDLGMARRPGPDHLRAAGGTIPWCAPERFTNSAWIDGKKCDVYSFGILVWELCAGGEKTPYGESDARLKVARPVSSSHSASFLSSDDLQRDLESLGNGGYSLFYKLAGENLSAVPEVPSNHKADGTSDCSSNCGTGDSRDNHRRARRDRFNERVIAIVRAKGRPQLDKTAPPAMVSLMERCWAHDPSVRPSFASLATELTLLLAEANEVNGELGSRNSTISNMATPHALRSEEELHDANGPVMRAIRMARERSRGESKEENDFVVGTSPMAKVIAMAKANVQRNKKRL